MKIINKKIIILGALLSPFLFFNHITSALSYESSQGISFTLNPSISVTVSGDLTIANLTPGDYKDSNSITVTANSNSIAGYTLSSTVGSSTNTSTELRKDGVDTTNKFSSITTNKASLSNFDDSTNTWGYSYSTDSGSTWISGDITGTPLTGYNGLPLYTSSSSIKLINSTTSGSSSVLFKIGARTTTNQIAGEYTNVINFIGVANPNPQPIYIQDLTLSQCQVNVGTNGNPENIGDNITVVDRRGNSIYTVRYINGECWMTQNLRITGTISAEYSNFTGDNFNVSQYSLDSTDSSYANHCDSTNGYNYACAKDSGNTSTGVWYNYVAATAGTIAGSSNTNPATEDICPANWHLPSGPNTTEGTDLNILIGNTTSGWQDSTAGLSTFNAVAGGNYYDGSLGYTGLGYWWSATARNFTHRYYLSYGSGDDRFSGDSNNNRSYGRFVRCVRSS